MPQHDGCHDDMRHGDLRRVIVLAEGQLADVTAYLNRDLLVSQWPVLRTLVGKTVRGV